MKSAESNGRGCPVCGGSRVELFARARDVEYYTTDDTYAYLHCESCNSVFLDNPPVDQLSRIYPRTYYSYCADDPNASIAGRVKEWLDLRMFRRLLRRVEGERLRVLDVGGGSGWMLDVARKASARVQETHEVDINEESRARAEAKAHIFHMCRAEELSCPVKFDLILMLNLIEHVADPVAVLDGMRRLLAPGGMILIKTPNVETLDCRLFRNRNWGGFHCPRHFVLFNRRSIGTLAEKCGLEIREAAYTQGAPQWTCSILGWLGVKGWIHVSASRPLYTHPLYSPLCAVTAAFDLLRKPFMATAQMFVVFQLPKNL